MAVGGDESVGFWEVGCQVGALQPQLKAALDATRSPAALGGGLSFPTRTHTCLGEMPSAPQHLTSHGGRHNSTRLSP